MRCVRVPRHRGFSAIPARAEIQLAIRLGADVIGMSSALEARILALTQARAALLSYVANDASGISDEVVSHRDVLELGESIAGTIMRLLDRLMLNRQERPVALTSNQPSS